MDYLPTIGIETHAQLLTASKMFCACQVGPLTGQAQKDRQQSSPNTRVCPVCLGMPGSLPVINRRAVEYVIMTGLALNCQVAEFSKFDRKNYHYPDLVKGYQISQFHLPLCHDGWLDVEVEGRVSRIGISDIHLEEDTGKLLHIEQHSLIDFNRSGVPLMEIVSAPDFCSVDAVNEYVVALRRLLRYLGVNSGNMEEGAMRFEANVSLRPAGSSDLGTRVEVKNLNSFRAVVGAVKYEIDRQSETLDGGGTIQRETRGWDDNRDATYVQRSKEHADDYRYFPEPDLPPLAIGREWVERIRSGMPELPRARFQRFQVDYRLPVRDAGLLTEDRDTADYFEEAVDAARTRGIEPKTLANWITGELFHLLHASDSEVSQSKVSPAQLVDLLTLLDAKTINITTAKQVLSTMFETGRPAQEIVSRQGLEQIANKAQLDALVDDVIAANPGVVAQYRSGRQSVLRFLIGQVMKATSGKADPQLSAEILQEKLSTDR